MAIDLSTHEFIKTRRCGVLLPLSAMRGAGDWGVGDMSVFKEWINYFASRGVKILQILPINETSPWENCPYSALSAYALDPVYISVADVEDAQNSPAAREIIRELQNDIAAWREQAKVQFKFIKMAKYKVLWAAYEYFLANEQAHNTARYRDFLAFQQQNNHWLVPYTIFRAAKDSFGWAGWQSWSAPLKNTEVAFLKTFAAQHSKQMMFFTYLQWLLQLQLAGVRATAQKAGVMIMGDIPFGVSSDSADVWANQRKYILTAETGAPGDAMAPEGQRWGLPAYNWPVIMEDNFNLWRAKIHRCCELYDTFRLDHLVGFFRTWIFDEGSQMGRYDLQDEAAQNERGQKFIEMAVEAAQGKLPIGEDLGMIPDYLRAYMRQVSLPGYKVLRWEKDDEVYRDPAQYPAASLAATSTHDTTMLKEWWETMQDWQRARAWQMISGRETNGRIPFDAHTHAAILQRVLASGSAMVVLPLQDIIGTGERINTPGTVSEDNWTYRVSAPPAKFDAEYRPQMQIFTDLIRETGR